MLYYITDQQRTRGAAPTCQASIWHNVYVVLHVCTMHYVRNIYSRQYCVCTVHYALCICNIYYCRYYMHVLLTTAYAL